MHWTARLEQIFPQGNAAFPNWRSFLEHGGFDIVEPGAETPVRVITVPKTMKTPRIIAIEPTCMQYVQQGLRRMLYDGVGRDNLLTHLIGFDDQTPNQRLALKGSLDGSLATLDMKEASDRVSNQLVRTLLMRYPSLNEAVDASRSRKADVPGFGVMRLAKFASMGSALTFPIEAMVFLTIVFCGIEKALKRQLTYKDLKSFIGSVRVYGDDIIVPTDYVPSVYRELENFGFLVNANKSYWTGRFRESCGKEYYAGHDVSIVRCRSRLPVKRNDVSEFIHTASLRNQLFLAGYDETVKWIDDQIVTARFLWPAVQDGSPIIGRLEHFGFIAEAFSRTLHVPLVKGHVVSAVLPASKLDGWFALMKFFTIREDLPIFDVKHLERYGRPRSVDIKTRMATPF